MLLPPSSQSWIQGISQPFPKEVEGENRHENSQPWEDRQPPGIKDVSPSLGEDIPPTRCRRLNSEPKKTEASFHKNGCGDIERCRHKDRSQGIGEDVPENDPTIRHSERFGRLGKISFSQ